MKPASHNISIDLSDLGLLHVAGIDAKRFLQGQITCNMEEVTQTMSRLGAHCNPQGRILSFFRVISFRDNYYLQMPQDMITDAIKSLQKYAVFFKVNLQDASMTFKRVGFSGTGLEKIFPLLPKHPDEVYAEDNILVLRLNSEIPHYEILGESNAIAEILAELHAEMEKDGILLWNHWQISAGIPEIYPSTQGKFLPHEVNLPALNAVSFEKGCYTGQEIIARMQYRGQLKKKMFQATVKTSTLPQPGCDIYQDSPCGTVVNSTFVKKDTCLMIVIADQTAVLNEQLFLDPDKKQPLEFTPLALGSIHV